MAQLDASVISQIPDSFDYSGSVAKGYALKDMIDRNQLNQLQISREKTAATDEANLKNLMTKGDITTPKGRSELASSLQKGGYGKQSMEVLRFTSEQAQAERQEMLDKLTLAQQQQDAVVSTIDPIIQKLDTLKATGKYTAKDLDDEAAREVRSAVPNFVSQRPELGQFAMQFMQNPQNLTYAGLKGVEGQTKTGQAMIRQRLDALSEARQAAFQKGELALREREVQVKERAANDFGGKPGELMAALAERGVSLPAGFRSKAQQKAMLDGLVTRHPEMSADELADKIKGGQIQFGAEKKETQTAAAMAGRIEVASNELIENVPYAMELSSKVPRGRFVPWNRLKQTAEANISDPDLKALKAVLTTISNNYDVVSSRGGTDVAKREHSRELFNAADSPEALTAALNVIQREAAIAKRATAQAMKPPSAETPNPGPKPSDGWSAVTVVGK